jgi:sugar phosphate isomerase/epimerase
MPPMTAPVAIQLYTVRELLAKDYAGVIRQIADIGYVGVEPAGFPGSSPKQAGRLFRELGLQTPSAHTPLPLGDRKHEVLDAMREIGCNRIVSGRGAEDFASAERIKAVAELFNQAAAVAAENGMTFGIHNHWWEFLPVDGRCAYEILLEHLRPDVFFQVDTYWVKTAGMDPATVVKQLGPRAALLHIKDGPCVAKQPQVAVGDGAMDVPSVIAAGRGCTDWLIVELDHCATDMLEAVRNSYRYLVGNHLAKGNKPV